MKLGPSTCKVTQYGTPEAFRCTGDGPTGTNGDPTDDPSSLQTLYPISTCCMIEMKRTFSASL